MLEPTSATLLMQLKQDGPRREVAWIEFRRTYAPIIAGFARKLGVPPQEVDDLIQDVMVGFFAVQPKFVYDPARGRFRGYLRTCVTNLLSRRRDRRLNIDGRPIEQIEVEDKAVAQAWDAAWEHEYLHRAVESVRRRYDDNATFKAFYRVALQQESPAAVAADLGMTLNDVYVAKSRCLARLRATLIELEEAEG